MRNSQIYYNGQSTALDLTTSHYVSRVLRKNVGSVLVGLDGIGGVYNLELIEIEKKIVKVQVLNYTKAPLPNTHLTLILSLYKSHRLEFALEKCTELGVTDFVLTETEFSSLRLDTQQTKKSRYESIILQACLQSEQVWFPKLSFRSFDDILSTQWNSPIIGVTQETPSPHSTVPPSTRTVLIGPEGGFTEFEVQRCISSGFLPVRPFSSILRSETAAIALTVLSL
jgi:16S rRNA (uracil1498-N3)-methyltransferase